VPASQESQASITWRTTIKPALLGAALGFIAAMGSMAIMEIAGVPMQGAGEPAWADSIVALTFFGGWAGITYALRARALRDISGRTDPPRTTAAAGERTAEDLVHDQVRRIAAKCRQLQSESVRTAPYEGLATSATELSAQADKLARQWQRLRRVHEEISAAAARPALADARDTADAAVGRELAASAAAQAHLESLLHQNQDQQQWCLARLERIEDLVDAARLEVTRPVGLVEPSGQPSIVDEVSQELTASRQALEQVERSEEA
jgi:hypothetical protein